MAEKKPVSYQDPYWQNLAASAEEKHGLPAGSLRTILTHGERSNANQVSEKGAKTVFQIIPATRNAILKNYGIDAYLSDENAADGAALLFKEALNRNNNDPIMAAREYHGGTDRSNWGPVNRDYAKRYAEGLAAFRGQSKNNTETGTNNIIAAQYIYDPVTGMSRDRNGEPLIKKKPVSEELIAEYENRKLTPNQERWLEENIRDGIFALPPKRTLEFDQNGNPYLKETPREGLAKKPTEVEQAGQQIIDEATGVASGVAGIAKDILSLPVGGVTALGQGVYDLSQNNPNFNAKESLGRGFARGVNLVQENLPGDSQASPTLNDVINAFPGAGSIEAQLAMRGSAARGLTQEQRSVNNVLQKAAIADKHLTDKGVDFVVGSGGAERQPYAPPATQIQAPPPAAVTPTVKAEDVVKRVADEGVTSGDMIPPTPKELATATQQVQRKIDYATANKDVVVAAINGDRKALDRLAQEANIDEDTLKAFEDLGVLETPTPVVSKNVAVKQVGQAAAAAPQSQGKIDYTNFIDETRRAVEDVAASGGKDLATVSTRVRDKLVEVEEALKKGINDGYDALNDKIAQASPEGHASFEIETPSVNKLIADEQTKLGTVNKKTGEWQPASANVLDKSYRSMLQRFAEGRTFARVDQMRKEIGAAMQGQGLFKDASTAFRSKVYRALTEDLDAAAEKMGFVDDVRALKDSVIEQKGLQDNITKVFGDTLDRDFVSKMLSLTKDVTTKGADNAKFKALMDMMPTPEMRAEALNATLYQSLTRRGGDVVQWGTFDQLWSNLHNLNPAGVSMFKKYLGEAAYNRWDAIGKVSKAISNFDQGVSRTGASLSTRLDQEANMMRGMAGKAVQAVAGALAARAGAGAIGSTVSRGALALFDKVIPEKNLEALAKMINSRAFLTAALSKTAKERSFHLNNLARGKMASAIFNGKPSEKDMEALIPNLKGVK